MPSTVPSPTFTSTGFVIPAVSDILSAVQNDINTVFGGTLDQDSSTPQGQLAQSLTAIISDKNNTFLYYASQTDPQYAQGRMQDAIAQIYFLTRLPAMPTLVQCDCSGLVGTVIPANSQAADTSGNIYICSSGGTIPAGGTISLQFESVVTGPIACPHATLTRIYSSISGWSGINNPTGTDTNPTTLGRDVESSQEFEYRRQQSVALNSIGMVQSTHAAVATSGLDLVPPNAPLDVFVMENASASPNTVKGVVLAKNSIYVAVVGGDPSSIAKAIWTKKLPGCNYSTYNEITASIATNVLTVTAVTYTTLAAGQFIVAPGVPAGTYIDHQISGSLGDTGTYQLSATIGTVASEVMEVCTGSLVYDTNYFPPVTYVVSFVQASDLPVYFNIQIINHPGLPADVLTQIANAVNSAFTGGDGGSSAHIGTDVFASRFYAPILAVNPLIQIVYVYVGTSPSPGSGSSVSVNLDKFPVTLAANVNVTLL